MEQNKNNELLALIRTGEHSHIIKAIETYKQKGDLQLLSALIELLYDTENQEIIDEIFSFLNDLKSDTALNVLIEFIQNDMDGIWKKELITAVWQSGMDASSFLSIFIDIVIEDEFITAFEASTVIENIQHQMPVALIEENIKKLEGALSSISADKKSLLESLITTLKNFKIGGFTHYFSEN